MDNSDNIVEVNKWDELDLDRKILRGIYAYGFEGPSPIQKKAIKPIIEGNDMIAQAQSGTGKTACFAIGALSRIDTTLKHTQVVVLSPTRELSIQSGKVISDIGTFCNDLIVDSCYLKEERSVFRQPLPHILCGCPGRILETLSKSRTPINNIRMIVMDEADELLSTGFKEQVFEILKTINNKNIQILLFSATIPQHIEPIIDTILRNPIRITVKSDMLTLEGISQFYIAQNDDQMKYETLKDLFTNLTISQCIIYCNTVNRVKELYKAMEEDDFPVCCIHSDMEKNERNNTFKDFKSGKSRVLISSNVTARGIDVQQVSIVINFDLPRNTFTYLHRIGRSGRWGRKGVGINFVTRHDINQLREIESYYNCQIREMPSDLSFMRNV